MHEAALRTRRQVAAAIAVDCLLIVAALCGRSIASEDAVLQHRGTAPSSASWLGDRLAANFDMDAWSNSPGSWSQRETEHFLVWINGATDDEFDELTTACESCLATISGHWHPQEMSSPAWRPKCIVVVHRTPESYENALAGRAGRSWGCATIKRNRRAIAYRRIDICATTPKRLAETFSHELTHVILADHFAQAAVPRWLDEGLAVLSEPAHKVARRVELSATEANGPPLIRSAEILTTGKYPPGLRCDAFYIESAQLVQLLLRDGGIQRLLRFAKAGMDRGYDAALREHYAVEGLAELDRHRQQNTAAGLILQASRKRMDTASERHDNAPVDGDPFTNASFHPPSTGPLPALGR